MGEYLIIGAGSFGSSVAIELHKLGHEVVVLDEDAEQAAILADQVTQAIIGDAKEESVLRSLGVDNFDCVVVGTANRLADSIILTLLLKDLHAAKIVCKAQDERHARALSLVGADVVIRPEHDMGKRVAHILSQKNIVDYIELSGQHSIVEMEVPPAWIGKSLVENDLRRKYGINVLAVRKAEADKVLVAPDADCRLEESDLLVVIGNNKALAAVGVKI